MNNTSENLATKLLRAVLAKTGLEVAFVCVVATVAAFHNASPLLRGAIDAAGQTHVAGWAYDPLTPKSALEVQLFIDDRFVRTVRADQARPDLVKADVTPTAAHGFSFELTDVSLSPGKHAAQVYALRNAAGRNKALIPLSKEPIPFAVSR
ncbi:MAG: hypothetical protein HOP19_02330 [Acidobacteria bacterium]|nr:hypothetical protein [Acidobacteriota bacterium]